MARHTDQRVVQEVPAPENTDRILCTDCLAHITHLHGRHVPLSVLELQVGRFGVLLSRISTKRNGQRFRRIRHPENPLHPAAFGTGHLDSVPDYTAYASFRQKETVGKPRTDTHRRYHLPHHHSAVNPAFSLLASVSKTKDYAEQFNYFGEAERDSLFNGLYPVKGENTAELLKTKRPNILIILMEGFGGAMVESLGGVKGASPNIDRLSKEGIWFSRCYANSFRTDRGTICTFSGYQSFPDLSVMKIPAKSRTLPSIAEKLAKEGYRTDFLYGGDINFTNMKSYLLGSGYQHLTADIDFPSSQRQNAWGVNDDITFDYLYDQLIGRKESPWHTAFLTLSSHEPFEVPFHKLEEARPNAFAFTDDCLGRFVERIRKTPVWDNLLIVCLPDHGFYYPEEGHPQDERIHRIPMLWLGGAIKQPMVVNKIMNQTDMAATLLAQMGISHEEFSFSRNVLGEEYTYPFAYWTFGGGFAFADSTGVTLFDVNADRPILERPAADKNRILRGKAILQSSYDDLGAR